MLLHNKYIYKTQLHNKLLLLYTNIKYIQSMKIENLYLLYILLFIIKYIYI